MSDVSIETARMLYEKGWLRDRYDDQFAKGDYLVKWSLAYMSPMKQWHITCNYLMPRSYNIRYYSNWFDTVDEALQWVEAMNRQFASELEDDDADV